MMLEKYIFFPRETHPALARNWKDSEIVLHLNNQQLGGWLVRNENFKPSKNGPFIIYYGGNAEDISINLNDLWKINASAFLFMNYRGYGNSSGHPTKDDLLADALAIYDHMISQYGISPSQIYLMGRSLGASIAAYVASQRQVGGIILVTPFDSVENLVKTLFRWLPMSRFFKESFDTQKYLAGVDCKILVLAAENDEVIPKECLESLISAYQDKIVLQVIAEANHQDINHYDAYYSALNDYLHAFPISENLSKAM